MSYLAKTIDTPMSPGEIRQHARAWYDRQIAVLAQAHGASWPQHQGWINDYLREELRERLHELGWRAPA
ncbi:hypothetical protein AAFF27_16595 [Xylophilus sp. GW821-FHT01B05]